MGRSKGFLLGSLTLVLVGALAVVAFADLPPGGTFVDDDGNTHEANIEAIFAEGITKGCNPPVRDRYCPDDPVTRAQMASFLTRMLSLADTTVDSFDDDGDSVHEADINRLAAADITRGCNPPANDLYCPDDPVTRAQMASFLVRALNLGPTTTDHFVDDGASVHHEDINRLAEAGITKGCNPPANDLYCPEDPVLRDQMASFLARALGLTPIQPPPPTTTQPGETTTTTSQTTTTVAESDNLLLSTNADRSDPGLFGGAVSGNIYAFVNPSGDIRQVEFHLDDPSASGSPFQIESEAPFDMGGTASQDEALPFSTARLTNGNHTITVEIIRDGAPSSVDTYSISVSNPKSLVFDPIALNVVLSAGDSQTLQVEVGTNNGSSTNFTVANQGKFGWLTVSPTTGSTGTSLTIEVDAAGLGPGVVEAEVLITSPDYRAGELPIRLVVKE